MTFMHATDVQACGVFACRPWLLWTSRMLAGSCAWPRPSHYRWVSTVNWEQGYLFKCVARVLEARVLQGQMALGTSRGACCDQLLRGCMAMHSLCSMRASSSTPCLYASPCHRPATLHAALAPDTNHGSAILAFPHRSCSCTPPRTAATPSACSCCYWSSPWGQTHATPTPHPPTPRAPPLGPHQRHPCGWP